MKYSFDISAAVPVPNGTTFVVYHLLSNGSDTNNCGGSVDSACSSLLHVLRLYYAKPPVMGLQISTDKLLEVDRTIFVSLGF